MPIIACAISRPGATVRFNRRPLACNVTRNRDDERLVLGRVLAYALPPIEAPPNAWRFAPPRCGALAKEGRCGLRRRRTKHGQRRRVIGSITRFGVCPSVGLLDGHVALEACVAGAPHLAHTAAAKQFHNLEVAQLRARAQRLDRRYRALSRKESACWSSSDRTSPRSSGSSGQA